MKTFLITGAAGHLGREVVNYFLNRGHRVIATVRDNASAGKLSKNDNLFIEVTDLTSQDQVSQMSSRVSAEHRVEGIILLAGGFSGGSITDTNIDLIRSQIQLNFETAYNVVRNVLPYFEKNKYGRIVLIGAQAALMPRKSASAIAYTLSKSLLFHLAETINEQYKAYNIVATVLAPSTIDTEANRRAMPHADFSAWVNPVEIARILEFVTSEEAASLREPVLKVYNKVS